MTGPHLSRIFFLENCDKTKTRRTLLLLLLLLLHLGWRLVCPPLSRSVPPRAEEPLVLLALPVAAAVWWVVNLSHGSPFYPHIKQFAGAFILVRLAYWNFDKLFWQTVFRRRDAQAGFLDLEPKAFQSPVTFESQAFLCPVSLLCFNPHESL